MVCWFTGFMKMTFDLPEDLVKELKLRSVHEGRKLKDVAAAAIQRGLHPSSTPASEPLPTGIMLTEDGFPVIRCKPDAPASRMTIKELLALEQQSLLEEDLQRAGLPR
jgi:hypothetical protein